MNKINKHLSICADDFGFGKNINKSIIELIDKKIITETSCIVLNINKFFNDFNELKKRKRNIDIGIHIFFTKKNQDIDTCYINYRNTFNNYYIKSHLNLINKNELELLINSQLDKFENFFNFPPLFIDSHMHIHQFPCISDIFIKIIKNRYYINKIYPWVRNSQNLLETKSLKKVLLNYYGTKFKKKLIQEKIFTNHNFEGIYDYNKNLNIKKYYKSILKNLVLRKGTLFMVHPGSNFFATDNYDEIYDYRINEFKFLQSNFFKKLLTKYNIKLGKLNKY